ncbi:MAG: hypothetical protein Q3971_00815 [Moraxella sp.]|nr:hypothetical protein [Moraxella sp.]
MKYPLFKSALFGTVAFMAMGIGQNALACSPNLPNYGNCVRQQQQAWQMQQQQQAMQQNGYYQAQQHPYHQKPIDLSTPSILMDKGKFAVAYSPSTGTVGASSFAWRDSQTHYRLAVGHETFALASCIAKTKGEPLSSISLEKAEKYVKKHGKKSDCQLTKQSDDVQESLVAILKGKLPNGKYQLFMTTRPNNTYLFSQEQLEFKNLMANCQAKSVQCEIIGQFGDKTELY